MIIYEDENNTTATTTVKTLKFIDIKNLKNKLKEEN